MNALDQRLNYLAAEARALYVHCRLIASAVDQWGTIDILVNVSRPPSDYINTPAKLTAPAELWVWLAELYRPALMQRNNSYMAEVASAERWHHAGYADDANEARAVV